MVLAFLGFRDVMSACASIATNNPVAVVTNSTAASTNLTGGVATNWNVDAELPVPVAIFDLASKSTKDPFFPLSLRSPVPVVTNSSPAFSVAEFTLKGLVELYCSPPSAHQ